MTCLALSDKSENLIFCEVCSEEQEDSKDFIDQSPVPEYYPVLLGFFCKALLPHFIQIPHLSVLIQVSICLFCQREIWSVQIKTGTVLTRQDDSTDQHWDVKNEDKSEACDNTIPTIHILIKSQIKHFEILQEFSTNKL